MSQRMGVENAETSATAIKDGSMRVNIRFGSQADSRRPNRDVRISFSLATRQEALLRTISQRSFDNHVKQYTTRSSRRPHHQRPDQIAKKRQTDFRSGRG